jgi:hypothetical protein
MQFITSKSLLQKILKGALHTEEKDKQSHEKIEKDSFY